MDKTFNISNAAKFLGFKVQTLQKWDKEGKLKPTSRTITNRRVYTGSQLLEFLQIKTADKRIRVIAYCRVSSQAQKADLKNQQQTIQQFCAQQGYMNYEFFCEVGGGLNFGRPKFLELMDSIEKHEVKMLIIAHKDRLVRFGFEWFERFLKLHGCELTILEDEKLSPEQEMVQDLVTIMDCFSSRLHRLRNYKKALKEALKNDNESFFINNENLSINNESYGAGSHPRRTRRP
ncbi:MAG: IS607 family transposase [Synergistaceae bacterium]|jgi:predicted site-specific integrase-resolvase|nr:IS607 family transposase [Synergistaceae bacterium]